MNKDMNSIDNNMICFKKISGIIVSKKWWFTGTFVIIFFAGVIFTFLRIPLYNSSSSLKFSMTIPDEYEELWKYFPEETEKLQSATNDIFEEIMVSGYLRSEPFLKAVSEKLSFNISMDDLGKAIYTLMEKDDLLKITVAFNDPHKAFIINKTVFDLYLDSRNSEISQAYKNLLSAVGKKVTDYSRNGQKNGVPGEESDSGLHNTLKGIENDLIINKEVFLDRIDIAEEPDPGKVSGYYNKGKDLVMSFFLALAMGFLIVFIVNYIQASKRK